MNNGDQFQHKVFDVEQLLDGTTEDAQHSSPATQEDLDLSAVFTPTSTSALSMTTNDCQIPGIPAM